MLYADMALQPSGPIRCRTDTPYMMRVSLVMTTRRMVPIVWWTVLKSNRNIAKPVVSAFLNASKMVNFDT